MKKETLEDIVRITGFSKTTISRVLNGKGVEFRISSDTIEKVLNTAREINYRPNLLAQTLRKKAGNTIALAVPHLSNPFFASIASNISIEAKKNDFMVMLFDTQEDPKLENNAIDAMVDYHVDGIIIVPCGESPKRLEEISKNIPVILVDRYFRESFLPYISTNNLEGAYQAMKLLLTSGHKEILVIGGPSVSVTTQERIMGCQKAMEVFGEGAHMQVLGNEFSIQNGYIETKLALQGHTPPTAIFALSHTIFLGTYSALEEQGLSIPDDVSVVTFANHLALDFMKPAITRVAQPIQSMGIAAIKLLVTCIREHRVLHSKMLMTPTLTVRNSVNIRR